LLFVAAALLPEHRGRLPTADLAERYAGVLEIEVAQVLSYLAGGLRLTLGELGVGEDIAPNVVTRVWRTDYGEASWLDPANRRLPSAVVTERAFEFVLPSRAREP